MEKSYKLHLEATHKHLGFWVVSQYSETEVEKRFRSVEFCPTDSLFFIASGFILELLSDEHITRKAAKMLFEEVKNLGENPPSDFAAFIS